MHCFFPASHELLVQQCPDCQALLPLHDPQGLETLKIALQKFNKESNQTSYFKLVEVGRISTQVRKHMISNTSSYMS